MKGALEAGGELTVGGEVTGFKVSSAGHWGFDLKDAHAKVKVFIFFNKAQRLTPPADGELVIVIGLATFKTDFGQAQIIGRSVAALGDGDQKKRLEALKRRLAEAGLFDVARKRALPLLPATVGLATSRVGQALLDVLKVIKDRNHTTRIILRDCRVQGSDAAADIADAIRRLDDSGLCDVILVVRGGGAREDLNAFDTEPVVRAIAACSVPVVAGVGHEVDISLADLAADVRAATPSQAAEFAVPVKAELYRRVDGLQRRLLTQTQGAVTRAEQRLVRLERRLPSPTVLERRLAVRLEKLEKRLEQRAPLAQLSGQRQTLDRLTERLRRQDPRPRIVGAVARVDAAGARLDAAIVDVRDAAAARLDTAVAALDALSPLAVLRRGWAIVSVPGATTTRLATPDDLQPGRRLRVRLSDVSADVVVEQRVADADSGSSS
jgi:exodeoxyribonuclease VII large subunit